ncbi:MAG: hypothetical protein A3J30_01845 [Candidatus Wildermuthbacteria bacterium RIFCSPLOWO2_02_FULL_47_9c]|nr:MAG: hypothetical protein A2109_02780 [Candidatus Wildermuthbacteria bacterium GWA1_49_26]OHA65362.1 MAG: hypothetical protein A2674_00945 [Candidatus Wildermuthbacteria bacterium RIFCSPHIGHO2_01_FULL_50_47]OHA69517.1 MAG: hypothetical protein A3D63_02870 [Candidatus Wildermuthbacteria bacterium RIFCSPHIGHO2_02_FULL_49_17]OHA76251.1 MAG: hypothetical protein A3J30_01845 [Candidatus Wildermuthbacteria bacterium RIFCSPLOWO2_02_FULL_47_9c]HCM36611.1 hypothetical protein [Candidatus Wildermuthba
MIPLKSYQPCIFMSLPKSTRKYIRREKARIRREVSDSAEQKKRIEELLQKFVKKEEKQPAGPETKKSVPSAKKKQELVTPIKE